MPIGSSLTLLPDVITNSSFCYDPAKVITRATMGSSFPTVTRQYTHPYLTGDQIQERGKNLNTVTEGETYSNLWMDDLIYATAIHASNHLHANGMGTSCSLLFWCLVLIHCDTGC